jgi:SAM-dependent methyltransferase
MNEPDFYREYYEKLHSVERKLTPKEESRIKNTIAFIPEDVESLLEVGCGDGRIVNRLKGKYEEICGLDISNKALDYVETPKVQGTLENLPFADNSFDIVICCEVLEHLPYSVYKKAVKEMERVSKKYILISVPNNENLEREMITCPECGCSSHLWRHLRSFNEERLRNLFKDFEIHKIKTHSSEQFMFAGTFFKIKRFLNINQRFPQTALCPQCGYSPEYEAKSAHLKKENKGINLLKKVLPLKKAGGWIIVLYKCSGS